MSTYYRQSGQDRSRSNTPNSGRDRDRDRRSHAQDRARPHSQFGHREAKQKAEHSGICEFCLQMFVLYIVGHRSLSCNVLCQNHTHSRCGVSAPLMPPSLLSLPITPPPLT
jgi:hypothetical protein